MTQRRLLRHKEQKVMCWVASLPRVSTRTFGLWAAVKMVILSLIGHLRHCASNIFWSRFSTFNWLRHRDAVSWSLTLLLGLVRRTYCICRHYYGVPFEDQWHFLRVGSHHQRLPWLLSVSCLFWPTVCWQPSSARPGAPCKAWSPVWKVQEWSQLSHWTDFQQQYHHDHENRMGRFTQSCPVTLIWP